MALSVQANNTMTVRKTQMNTCLKFEQDSTKYENLVFFHENVQADLQKGHLETPTEHMVTK